MVCMLHPSSPPILAPMPFYLEIRAVIGRHATSFKSEAGVGDHWSHSSSPMLGFSPGVFNFC